VTLSAAEYQRLTGRIDGASTSSSFAQSRPTAAAAAQTRPTWIIDSGASHHFTGSPIQGGTAGSHYPPVALADGTSAPVVGLGSVPLSSSVTLQSTLHVPSFSRSLISISKLTRDLQCSVTFFSGYCVFQDLHTGRMLGGELREMVSTTSIMLLTSQHYRLPLHIYSTTVWDIPRSRISGSWCLSVVG
jgi:hypothetical protein